MSSQSAASVSQVAPKPRPKVFWSGHLTSGHETTRKEWLSPLKEEEAEVKASMPPFNLAEGLQVPPYVSSVNAPVFGPSIANAVMRMFEPEEMQAIAAKLGVTLPAYTLSKFVQDKMPKVRDMISYSRAVPELSSSADAIDRLELFVAEFETLTPEKVNSAAAWEAFVQRHVASGWESKLHFDLILGNFGFDKAASDKLRAAEFMKADGETVTFEQHALRWLSKAFSAYGPEGALADVVNAVFVMTGAAYDSLSDVDVAKRIDQFQQKVRSKDFSGLWIPTHFFMDAEVDDCMVWVLLAHVCDSLSSKLNVLIQLPPDAELDGLAQRWDLMDGCAVWRDPHSRNAKAVKTCFRIE